MAEGIDAASFEFYEGIRILIPGAIAVGLAEGVSRTVTPGNSGLGLSTFTSFVASLLIGLAFYFVDAPAKAAVAIPLRPTDTLFSWKVRPRTNTTTLNNYFVMLDESIPAPIRARALYMGSMYRIGFEAVYLLAITSAAVLSFSSWTTSTSSLRVHRDPVETWIGAAALTLVWVYSLYLDTPQRRDEKRKKRKPTDVPTKHFSWWDAFVTGLLIAVFVVLVVASYHHHDAPAWMVVSPSAGLFALWAVRYFRGYVEPETRQEREARKKAEKKAEAERRAKGEKPYKRKTKRRRRPIAAVHACLLLLVAQLLLLAVLVERPASASGLSVAELRAWLVCAFAAMVLVCARGHERRLRGAYVTQSTWLELHKDEIIEAYFTEPTVTPAVTPPKKSGFFSCKKDKPD